MADIDRYEIFIATFIARFDENRLKPNTGQGLSLLRHLLISQLCYENCENILGFANV